jgi:hypothetical protein
MPHRIFLVVFQFLDVKFIISSLSQKATLDKCHLPIIRVLGKSIEKI